MIGTFKALAENQMNIALSPTGYKKRTGQFLRALHVYSINNFVAF
jgi:hypothetical protein